MIYSRLTSKTSAELRGCFSQFKADDAGGLSPGKEDNAEMWKTNRKAGGAFVVNRLYDLIIIGAGAAGLFAAANAPSNQKILLLEKTSRVGQKLYMAGGGQCNLTNDADIKTFLTRYGANGRLLRPVLFPFSNRALMSWFEARGLPLVVREDGKVFPASMKSNDVIKLFTDLAAQKGVPLRLDTPVTGITPLDNGFDLQTPTERLHTRNVLVTTGGASYPQTGSDGSFFTCLEELGIPLIPCRPALAAIHVCGYPYAALSGISVENVALTLTAGGVAPIQGRGDLLFTHRAFSGPVILTHSRYVTDGMTLTLNYLPQRDTAALRKTLLDAASGDKRQLLTLLESVTTLPRRLLETICLRATLSPDVKASHLSGAEMAQLATLLTADIHQVSKTGGFGSAMVTAGGVALDAVDLRTMQSRAYPGLCFAGEVLDVDGDTGGYNLQFAFSSAMRAMEGVG